jgi:RHS repeat-associated protein
LASYFYDHRGLRSRKVTTAAAPQGTGTVVYHHDEAGHLLAETSASGAPLITYVWRDDTPQALIVHAGGNKKVLYLEVDHLGSPIAARNQAGRRVWRWESDAFGSTAPSEDPDGDGIRTTINLRFPGQYFDAESALHYNWARYYDPKLGRYISADPIGVEGGDNAFAYAAGNSVSNTDPTGEFVPQLIGFGIGAGLEYLTNPCASATDIMLAGGLGALGGGLSKAAFLRVGPRSLTRETGLEWSHSIARSSVNRHTSGGVNRVLNQRGGLNGSWRTPASHARHDASRHVPGVDPMPLPLRALDRIPDWLKGTGLGGGVGAAVAGGNCECRR